MARVEVCPAEAATARDTPAGARRLAPRPGFLASMVVSACLGVPLWTTVDHNI